MPALDVEKFVPEPALPVETPWQTRLELPEVAPDPEDMTEDMLPTVLRDWIIDTAKRACVHIAFVAVVAMCSLGATVGRILGIYPKRRDSDWLETPNLWAVVIAPPSSLKTHAVKIGSTHIKRLASKATKAYKEQVANNKAKKEILEIELKRLKKTAQDADTPTTFQEQIKAKLEEIAALEAVTERRYIINDISMEKAGMLFEENPRGLFLLRNELVGLLKTCDKPGYESFRPFLLEAWDGTGSYPFDRVSRASITAPTTLSIAGGIQPGRLRSYIAGAIAENEEADGLLQRFQLLVWFDRARVWKLVDEYPDKEAKEQVFRLFEFLEGKLPELVARVLTFEPEDIPGLHFDEEAQGIFNEWYDALMKNLRSGGFKNTPAFEAHLAKYPKLVCALALLFHLCDLGGHNANNLTSVSAKALNLSIRWAKYLEQHARKLYALELNTALISAETLAEKIMTGEIVDGQNVSEIYQHKWAGLTKAAEVEAAMKILEEVNWLRVETVTNEGARVTKILRLHPDFGGGD